MGTIFDKKYVISNEMIATQVDDPVLLKIETCFDNLKTRVIELGAISNSSLYHDKIISAELEKLDKIIADRFGINFKHVLSDSMSYGIYTSPPKNFNVLNPEIEEVYEDVDSWYGNSNTKALDKIKFFERDYESIMKRWLNSVDALEKTLNASGVVVDREKAKITGLPKDYVLFIIMDLNGFINRYNQTSKNFVAISLHEIGHGFTHIEDSVRTVKNTKIILDAISDSLLKKNKSKKEAMLIAYEKAFPSKKAELDKLKSKNTAVVSLTLANEYMKECVGFNPTNRASVDSEALADQFVSRFGLASELADSLAMIYDKDKHAVLKAYCQAAGSLGLIYFIWVFVITNMLMTALTVGFMASLLFVIVSFLMSIIRSVVNVGGLLEDKVYDENKKRLQRLRNDVVRQIRTSNLTPELTKQLLSDLTSLDKIIKTLPDDNIGLFNTFMRKFTSKGKILSEYNAIEESIEFLMENDLHAVSAKFKLLKDSK